MRLIFIGFLASVDHYIDSYNVGLRTDKSMWLACCVTVIIIERQGVEKDIKQLP